MAQYRLNAYDADVFIPEFRGLYNYGDEMGSDLRYSPECMNVETIGGALQPAAALDGMKVANGGTDLNLSEGVITFFRDADLENSTSRTVPVGGTEKGQTVTMTGAPTYLFVIGAAGKFYYNKFLGDPMEKGTCDFRFRAPAQTITDNRWCFRTYQRKVHDPLVPSNVYMVNTLLASNGTHGMYAMNLEYNQFYVPPGEYLDVDLVSTPAKFDYIERYAERIWGVRDDMIYYSRPYEAADWTDDSNDPANGGGSIRIPTFDKDRLCAIQAFGDSLIFFSYKRAWKLTGSDPTNFMIQEQYGNGTSCPESIAVIGSRIIMLGVDGGLVAYDGNQVTPILKGETEAILKTATGGFRAAAYGGRYLLSFTGDVGANTSRAFVINESGWLDPNYTGPYNTSTPPAVSTSVSTNKHYRMLIYDTVEGTVTVRDTPQILSFCAGEPYALCRDGDKNYIVKMVFNSWEQRRVTGKATKWVSPWITLGREDIKKGGFEFYFTPEIAKAAVRDHQLWFIDGTFDEPTFGPSVFTGSEVSGTVTLKISIQTEKKTKTKSYTVQPLTADEISAGKQHKMKRLHFGGAGRRFRIIIETEAAAAGATPIPWRLIGGIQIIAETDAD